MKDCIFCKIINGETACHKIYEDDFVIAFLDTANDIYGHTLVVPKKHVQDVTSCDVTTLTKIIETCKKIGTHYVEDCGFDGVNVFNASGKAAEQSVFHLHFHIIPRKIDDGLHMWPLEGKQQLDLGEICKKLAL